jgi:hypothetical protein
MSRSHGAPTGIEALKSYGSIPSAAPGSARLSPGGNMKHRDLADLGSKLTARLEAGDSLEPADLLVVGRMMHVVNRRCLIAVLIWLSVLVGLIIAMELLEARGGNHDESTNGVIISFWILSIGIVCLFPDYGLSKIRSRLECRHCRSRIGTRKSLATIIEKPLCPRCGKEFFTRSHECVQSDSAE